jgi:hypothetical protein
VGVLVADNRLREEWSGLSNRKPRRGMMARVPICNISNIVSFLVAYFPISECQSACFVMYHVLVVGVLFSDRPPVFV